MSRQPLGPQFCTIGVVLGVGLGLRRRQLLAVLAWCGLTVPLGALGELAMIQLLC